MKRLLLHLSGVVAVLFLSNCASTPKNSGPIERGVLQELWDDVPGFTIAEAASSASLTTAPTRAMVLASFDTTLSGDDYCSRLRARLKPPADGDYTFWLASDDNGELWLSSDESASNAHRIAFVPDYTDKNSWTNYPSQKSPSIFLYKSRRYYIEARFKEGGGDDFLQVAWDGPTFSRRIITNTFLSTPPITPALRAACTRARDEADSMRADATLIEATYKSGRTLPVAFSAKYPPSIQVGTNDTGINILLDHAHQTSFQFLWGMSSYMRGEGYRVCGSEATLDTVLTPGTPVRIRLPFMGTRPFAWWPVPKFNVVITYQGDPNAQEYLPEERTALERHVAAGGGLVIFGGTPRANARWSMNDLAARFGASYLPTPATCQGTRLPALKLDGEWEVLAKGDNGEPVKARRQFGKGRVVLMPSCASIYPDPKDGEAAQAGKRKALHEMLRWAAAGMKPVGGSARMPVEQAGGGGIYPELEQNLGGVVVFYARNQKPALRKVFEQDLPIAKERVYKWLPTTKPDCPMFIIAAAGDGGGWAHNGIPKENGIIALEPGAIVGVFGHELAHTMCGPANDKGVAAGRSPHGVQGEAHSGWFQGKAEALYTGNTNMPNRNCNDILEQERKNGRPFDIAVQDNWGKQWWIWQKLDDRYGTTWFPRWYWVRATRWKNKPDHVETWDEMVEDMCIAVGEDLFPFFRSIGTTLKKGRLETIVFQGAMLELPVAPLTIGPAGPVRLEFPGDYKKPLPPPPPPALPTR